LQKYLHSKTHDCISQVGRKSPLGVKMAALASCVSLLTCCIALLVLASSHTVKSEPNYLVGRGMADITGPVAEINMMGYAKGGQDTSGIHLRLHSRAFIIANTDGSNPVVFVSADQAMISQLVKHEVMKKLAVVFGDLYTDTNVMLTGTHTHSGPGAYHQYILFEVTSKGMYKPSLDAMVDGIVKSITDAHGDLQHGDLYLSTGILHDSNINRSPAAYLNNPKEERDRYPYDTDRTMTVLKIKDSEGKPLGMINWFAVHPTSMNNTNTLISSDNKGVASILFENDMNPDSFPGEGPFVAAFANSNLGDVSPNTQGARCIDTGAPCDLVGSTCGDGKVQNCIASGPGKDMFESTLIIGTNQYLKAKELYAAPGMKLAGPVDSRLRYEDFSNYQINRKDGTSVHTCPPAMGFSFAAGTTDGPGAFNFKQGDVSGNPFWNVVRSVIKHPSRAQQACHSPKPILLNTGEMTFPYEWAPNVVDFQVFRIGQLAILGVPGEFTTMAGRRARESVAATLLAGGFPEDTSVVLAGFANSYADYMTTFEEYQVQRYEGASTIYGPNTLEGMIQVLNQLAEAITQGTPVEKGTAPPNLLDKQIQMNFPVIYDGKPLSQSWGGVVTQPGANYNQGETAKAVFQSGHPRNSNPLHHNYMSVQQLQKDYTWKVIFKDSNWETKFNWQRTNSFLGYSEAHLTWNIPDKQTAGTYRFMHSGHYKQAITGSIYPYKGYSAIFNVGL